MDASSTATKVITHTGTVTALNRDSVIVRLSENIHCEGCRAKAVCGVAESPSKEVEVMHPGGFLRMHDTVEVILKKELGMKAVFWAYVLPFGLVLLTLLTTSVFLEEWLAGLLALLVLIPYFAGVALFRDFFRKTFRFTLIKTQSHDGQLVT